MRAATFRGRIPRRAGRRDAARDRRPGEAARLRFLARWQRGYDRSSMNRARLLLVPASLLVASCGTLLGLRDNLAAPGDGPAPEDAGPADERSVEPLEAAADIEAGPPCAAHPGALLCDGFESGDVSPRWRKVYSLGTGDVIARAGDGAGPDNK